MITIKHYNIVQQYRNTEYQFIKKIYSNYIKYHQKRLDLINFKQNSFSLGKNYFFNYNFNTNKHLIKAQHSLNI